VDRRFILAFTDPQEVDFLGYRLPPFCLRHRVRLHAINSPFVEAAQFTTAHMLAAIKTCAGLPIDEVTGKDKALLYLWAKNDDRLSNDLLAFRTYMLESHWPKFWESQRIEQRVSGVPWILNLVANLISNGVPDERAWTMPECQAVWLSTTFSGMKGAEINLLTTEDEEAMAAFTSSQG
jgi:hypothetical protein